MITKTACPYFGRSEELCEMGCGPASAHDVDWMVRHCNADYRECSRYSLVRDREGLPVVQAFRRDLVTQVSHAVRTPLTSIRSCSEILLRYEQRDPEKSRKFAQIINEEAERLTRAVEELLDTDHPPAQERPAPSPDASPENRRREMTHSMKNRGWTVALAGTGINLALGILYAWSIFKDAIKASIEKGGDGAFRWELSSLNDPYAVCCLVFSVAMIVAGKCQDRIGPRVTALLGGLLVSAGFLWISQSTSYTAWVLGFGVLAGAGIGFGYSAATPPALKWFPSSKTGVVAGLVVAGFGLASVYIAPLSTWLVKNWGLQSSMLFFGLGFLAVVGALSTLLVNPPQGYVPEGAATKTVNKASSVDLGPSQIIRQPIFYVLWMLFFIGSGAGLMVIGSVAGMAKKSLGDLAFLAVAVMAVGNAGGRVVAGLLSDRIGRARTLLLMLCFQSLLMFAAIPIVGTQGWGPVAIVLLATFIGFNYGTNLCLFPSFAKDLWGLKNFGINYGVLFSAWGLGGFVMGRVSEMIKAATGNFNSCFAVAGVLLAIAAAISVVLTEKRLSKEPRPATRLVPPFMRPLQT